MSDVHKFLLVRSARLTLVMVMNGDGDLVVRSPRHISIERIRNFVTANGDWIDRKRKRMLARPQPKLKLFIDEEEFLFLGQSHYLRLTDESCRISISNGNLILPQQCLGQAAEKLTQWYKSQARQHIEERCTHFAVVLGVAFKGIHITSPRQRWGSCGSRGTLNFNWRLVMAPPEVIDYVVIHEMTHLKYFNHSPEFWVKVKALSPDFKRHQAWLKANKHRLAI